MKKKISLLLTLSFILVTPLTTLANDYAMSFLYGGTTHQYKNYVDRTNEGLNAISPDYFKVDKNGELLTNNIDQDFINEVRSKDIKIIPLLSNFNDRSLGIAAIDNSNFLAVEIADTLEKNNLDGVTVDLNNLTEHEKDGYLQLLEDIKTNIGEKSLNVAVAANPDNIQIGWYGSYDYERIGEIADEVIVMSFDEAYNENSPGPVTSSEFVENTIETLLLKVPSEKIVLGVSFYGRFWKEDSNQMGTPITNMDINMLLDNYNSNVIYDEDSNNYKARVIVATSDDKPKIWGGLELDEGIYEVWYEDKNSILNKKDLVKEYNLKGIAAWSLGQEDITIWNKYEDEELAPVSKTLDEGKNENNEIVNYDFEQDIVSDRIIRSWTSEEDPETGLKTETIIFEIIDDRENNNVENQNTNELINDLNLPTVNDEININGDPEDINQGTFDINQGTFDINQDIETLEENKNLIQEGNTFDKQENENLIQERGTFDKQENENLIQERGTFDKQEDKNLLPYDEYMEENSNSKYNPAGETDYDPMYGIDYVPEASDDEPFENRLRDDSRYDLEPNSSNLDLEEEQEESINKENNEIDSQVLEDIQGTLEYEKERQELISQFYSDSYREEESSAASTETFLIDNEDDGLKNNEEDVKETEDTQIDRINNIEVDELKDIKEEEDSLGNVIQDYRKINEETDTIEEVESVNEESEVEENFDIDNRNIDTFDKNLITPEPRNSLNDKNLIYDTDIDRDENLDKETLDLNENPINFDDIELDLYDERNFDDISENDVFEESIETMRLFQEDGNNLEYDSIDVEKIEEENLSYEALDLEEAGTLDLQEDAGTLDLQEDKNQLAPDTMDIKNDKNLLTPETFDEPNSNSFDQNDFDQSSLELEEEILMTNSNVQKETLDLQEEAGTLDLQEDAGTLDLQEDAGTLDLQEDAETLDLQEDKNQLSPDTMDIKNDKNIIAPDTMDIKNDKNIIAPDTMDIKNDKNLIIPETFDEPNSNSFDQNDFDQSSLELEEEILMTNSNVQKETLDLQEEAGTLDLQEDAGTLELQEDAGTLDLQEEAGTLDLQEDAETLDLQEDKNQLAPDTMDIKNDKNLIAPDTMDIKNDKNLITPETFDEPNSNSFDQNDFDQSSLELEEEILMTNSNVQKETLDLQEEAETLDLQEEAGTLDLQEDAGTLDLQEDAGTLDLQEDKNQLAPDTMDIKNDKNIIAPDTMDIKNDKNIIAPDTMDIKNDKNLLTPETFDEPNSNSFDQNDFDQSSLELEEEILMTNSNVQKETLDLQEEAGTLDLQEDAGTLDLQEEAGTLDLQEDAETLDLQEDKNQLAPDTMDIKNDKNIIAPDTMDIKNDENLITPETFDDVRENIIDENSFDDMGNEEDKETGRSLIDNFLQEAKDFSISNELINESDYIRTPYITRGQAVKSIMLMSGLDILERDSYSFRDIEDSDYKDYIETANFYDIINIKSEYFLPEEYIEKAEFVIILENVFDLPNSVNFNNDLIKDINRNDDKEVYNVVNKYYEHGIIVIDDNDNFYPNENLAKDDFIKILYNMEKVPTKIIQSYDLSSDLLLDRIFTAK